jgi:hypothetical protein
MKGIQARLFWVASGNFVQKGVHMKAFSCGAHAGLQVSAELSSRHQSAAGPIDDTDFHQTGRVS